MLFKSKSRTSLRPPTKPKLDPSALPPIPHPQPPPHHQHQPRPKNNPRALQVPPPWSGSMLTFYDFIHALRNHYTHSSYTITQAVSILMSLVPEKYHSFLHNIPPSEHENEVAHYLNKRHGQHITDALLDYFIQRVRPPNQRLVQLAHTHNFMTAECLNLHAVKSFNTFHRNLANRARASDEIRKYAYIQALDKNAFASIRLDIDPALSYEEIQQFVLHRACEELRLSNCSNSNNNSDDDTPPIPPKHIY